MHHLHLLNIARITTEILQLRVLLVKLIHPGALEVNGVQQIGNSTRLHAVDELRNHSLCLLLTPGVDAVSRLL